MSSRHCGPHWFLLRKPSDWTPVNASPANHALSTLTPRHPQLICTRPTTSQPKLSGTCSLPRGPSLHKANTLRLGEVALSINPQNQALKIKQNEKTEK